MDDMDFRMFNMQSFCMRGRDINEKELLEVEVKHEEISSLADEICKAVTVE